MRYEHIVLDLSTAACAAVYDALRSLPTVAQPVEIELDNLRNELRARLQRRDVDARAVQEDDTWLTS